jgi:hypothetical protein
MLIPGIRHAVRHWGRDEHGDAIAEFVLILPLFVILLVGSYQVWKLVHLKQTLEGATIEATRYLSVEGPYIQREWPQGWQWRAEQIVRQELTNEPIFQDDLPSMTLVVDLHSVRGIVGPQCPGGDAKLQYEARDRARAARFAVRSQLELPLPIHIPFLTLPERLTLTETEWHYLECNPNDPELDNE